MGCDELEEKLDEIEAQAMSAIIVGHKPHQDCKGEVLGILAVGDAVRSNAAATFVVIANALRLLAPSYGEPE